MVKHNRQNTLLMEILIVVLFFALCSTVILNVFVGAHNQSERAGAQADALIAAQEYKVTDKLFFGTDFPFARVDESVEGLVHINDQLEGTKLPRVSAETIAALLASNPFAHWWHGDNPLS